MIGRKSGCQDYLEPKLHNFYIFCEGERTEPNYFEGFKQGIESNPIYREMVRIQIEPCQAETFTCYWSSRKICSKE